jgi:folate-dependent phosphoribosylglycinamide formyltransferase PurN
MKIIVFTQEDSFFIPRNIEKLINVSEVIAIVNINNKGALKNKIHDFINWFGLFQVAKMGSVTLFRKIQDILDRCFDYKVANGYCSVKSIAKKNNIPYWIVSNINNTNIYAQIKALNADLIVSYSAPQVIKEPLLSLPIYGIINVHGSLLPYYRGCMPSFWYLFNDEKIGGATVHYMSSQIDDGEIIIQETVSLENCKSMFQIMNRTKKLGGNLVIEAVKRIEMGTVIPKANNSNEGSYFPFPSIGDAKKFRKKGKRLI